MQKHDQILLIPPNLILKFLKGFALGFFEWNRERRRRCFRGMKSRRRSHVHRIVTERGEGGG